jgi:hypothetical protein
MRGPGEELLLLLEAARQLDRWPWRGRIVWLMRVRFVARDA